MSKLFSSSYSMLWPSSRPRAARPSAISYSYSIRQKPTLEDTSSTMATKILTAPFNVPTDSVQISKTGWLRYQKKVKALLNQLRDARHHIHSLFLGRIAEVTCNWGPLDGQRVNIRAPRLVAPVADAFAFASKGNVEGLRTLFLRREASMFDSGVNPHETDQIDRSPIDQVWNMMIREPTSGLQQSASQCRLVKSVTAVDLDEMVIL
ncbi:hypothetical protein B0H67DRAFT_686560 [Lasiosphaeris hirsuta]|uniref:Uncharacterized protein n=1 Tax=Lasiosphaeris hirsuta TaxID=260670 RepID=A0AA40DPB1_9PEZI|nr:hypothetical protein B0H67DRAFT_686560 [Lasiosphaeris hirsuta]